MDKLESPRSLVARIREERAQERKWQKETAKRKKKYQSMEKAGSLAQQEGQLTTAALSSHNEERMKKARAASFAKRNGLPPRSDCSRPSIPASGIPPSSSSGFTYADSLSRIETASTCSAVPLSLLGAIPPSTAAGKVTPSCNLLSERLSARKRLHQQQEEAKAHDDSEQSHQPNYIQVEQQPQEEENNASSPRAPSPVSYETVSKSVSEFLALEKEASQAEVAEAQSKKSGPTIFSVLPAINEGRGQPPLRMNLPPPKPMPMAQAEEKPVEKKMEKKRAASKPVVPRGTTAPQKRGPGFKPTVEAPIPPPKVVAPKSIVKPFLKRAESAKRLPVPAEPEVKIIKDGESEVQVFRPGAFGYQQDRQRGVRFNAALANGGDVFTAPDGVQFNVVRSVESSMMASGTSARGSFAEALRMAQLPPTSTVVAGGPDGEAPPPSNSGGSIFFGGARPDLFMEDEGEFINMPTASTTTATTTTTSTRRKSDAVVAALQEYDGDLPIIECPELPDEDEEEPRASASPSLVEEEDEAEEPVPESARPENVLPTGFSMEEEALMAALNKLNKKAKKVEERLKGKKLVPQPAVEATTKTTVDDDDDEPQCIQEVESNTLPASKAPFTKYQPTPFKSRRQAGGRRYIGIRPQ